MLVLFVAGYSRAQSTKFGTGMIFVQNNHENPLIVSEVYGGLVGGGERTVTLQIDEMLPQACLSL
jgi:hypothetical protein